MNKTVLCPYCKQEIQVRDPKCKHCGKDLSKKKRLLLYLLPAVCLMMLPAVSLAAFTRHLYIKAHSNLTHGKSLMKNEQYAEAGIALDKAMASSPTRKQQQAIAAEKLELVRLQHSSDAFSQGILRISGPHCGDAAGYFKKVWPGTPKYAKAQELLARCNELSGGTAGITPGPESKVPGTREITMVPGDAEPATILRGVPQEREVGQPAPSAQEAALKKLENRIHLLREAIREENEILRREQQKLGRKDLAPDDKKHVLDTIARYRDSMAVHGEELREQEGNLQAALPRNR